MTADASVLIAADAPRSARGTGLDRAFEILCFTAATFLLAALGGLIVSLMIGGWPAFAHFGIGFFFSAEWDPVKEIYGAAGAVTGTLVTATLALIFALPLALGVAIFLVELCPSRLRRPIGTAVELSAGILSASLILAVMILPFMAATLRELFLTIPPQVRESAYGLGSTTFEVIGKVSLPYIRTGAIGAVMLGLGRALGETMAVTFIIGNSHGFPTSMFASGSTIASTIANEFAEATGVLHTSSLIALGLVLFVITFIVLALARVLIGKQANL